MKTCTSDWKVGYLGTVQSYISPLYSTWYILSVPTSVADPRHLYTDPDPDFHFDADPDPSFLIKAQNLEKVLK
jgi:hypothetical protein